eukprot:TRINITY_DN100611_c0_g1_i1.p1 TRINITY_DN100611_c0_g1~~TRINITY_DN100611_c0_g1_i1.p1  ORF type:complete len:236 (+),score=33.44 TRINITY_DN100611_c0_g1_i1:160-867(+)
MIKDVISPFIVQPPWSKFEAATTGVGSISASDDKFYTASSRRAGVLSASTYSSSSSTMTLSADRPTSTSWADWTEEEQEHEFFAPEEWLFSKTPAGRRIKQMPLPNARRADSNNISDLYLLPPSSPAPAMQLKEEADAEKWWSERSTDSGGESHGRQEDDESWQPAKSELSGVPLVGSMGHEHGECKPCAHFWRPAGCHRGDQCERCHLCSQEAFKQYRQKVKSAKRRRRKDVRK